jgi:AraC-like DNA-binding protein
VRVDEYTQARPAVPLRPFVESYSGYRQAGVAPARHRGLPSPYLTLIFTLDDPLEVAAHPDPRHPPGRYDALIGGLHLTPALITHPGRQSGVQVALRPLGCRALFGMPAAELVFADLRAADVLGAVLVDEVRDRLRTAPDWPSRFAALDGVLLRHLRPGVSGSCVAARSVNASEVAPEIVHACRRLLDEQTPVAVVADEVGWSARYLADRFRAEVGLRPKEAARVARFHRARRQLTAATRLADLAAAHGFSDQSHLVREFHAFAGCTPSDLAGELILIEALRDS